MFVHETIRIMKLCNHFISVMYSLSKEGRVIIMSIHQPRYSIFRLFDHLTLLSRGEIVYQGKAFEALSYFSNTLSMHFNNSYIIPCYILKHFMCI